MPYTQFRTQKKKGGKKGRKKGIKEERKKDTSMYLLIGLLKDRLN